MYIELYGSFFFVSFTWEEIPIQHRYLLRLFNAIQEHRVKSGDAPVKLEEQEFLDENN